MSARAAGRRVERVRRILLRRGLRRVQMSLMLAATCAAGFVASFLMLRFGLSAMWLRYALAAGCRSGRADGVFTGGRG
jgi:hypothetical protein